MPSNRDSRKRDVDPRFEHENQDWYARYEKELEEKKEQWRKQERDWGSEQSRWERRSQATWRVQQLKNRVIEEKVTGNFLRTLKIIGGIIFGVSILLGIGQGIQSTFTEPSSSRKTPSTSSQTADRLPDSVDVTQNTSPISPKSSRHPDNPKSQCGDPTPSASDYPLLRYPVSVEYTARALGTITSHYCKDAHQKGTDKIIVASFQRFDDAEQFSQTMQEAVGNAEVGKPVWLDSPSKVGSFPKEECGDLELSNNQSNKQFYRVYLNNQSGLLGKVQSRFCKDAQEKTLSTGENLIQVAAFSNERRALKFKEFITSHLGVNGNVKVVTSTTTSTTPSMSNSQTTSNQHESLLQQCNTPSSEDYLNGEYKLNWVWGNESYEGLISMDGARGAISVEYPNEGGWNPTVRQSVSLKSCSFGIAFLGSEPIDLTTNQPHKTYLPDHIFVKAGSNGTSEIIVCSQGTCVETNQ